VLVHLANNPKALEDYAHGECDGAMIILKEVSAGTKFIVENPKRSRSRSECGSPAADECEGSLVPVSSFLRAVVLEYCLSAERQLTISVEAAPV